MVKPDLKKILKWENVFTLLLVILLVSEFIFIININLFHIADTVDEDFAGMIRHTMEIAKNNKLLLDNWFYPTTGEFDTSLLLATLFYRACSDIFISFAIVNIINAFLMCYIIARLCRIADMGINYMLMVLCMVFAAYDFGMLSYVNMLFYGGSQYAYKAVLPMFFLVILFTPINKFKEMKIAVRVRTVIEYILFYSLFFLTSFSSGIYVFFVGLIPILLTCYIIQLSNDNSDKVSLFINTGITGVVAAVGCYLNKKYDLQMHSFNSDLMKLRHDTTFTESFNNVLDRFAEVINPVRSDVVDAMTAEGISSGIKWLMVVFVCIGLVFIPRVFGIYLVKRDKGKSSVRDMISACLVSVFVWNFFIMLITVSKSRYHLIGFLPLMMLAVMFFEELLRSAAGLQKLFVLTFVFMYGFFEYSAAAYTAPAYYEHVNLKSYVMEEDFCRQLMVCAAENKVNNIIFVNVVEEPEIMRVYDPMRDYETYLAKNDVIYNYDFYMPTTDVDILESRCILVITDEGYNTLKDGLIDNFSKIDRIGDFDILIRN